MIYIALVKPHDCFTCLSIVPEMRITNFQLDRQEKLRREYLRRYGGCCQLYPTCGRRLKFNRLVSFERKVRRTSIAGHEPDNFFGSESLAGQEANQTQLLSQRDHFQSEVTHLNFAINQPDDWRSGSDYRASPNRGFTVSSVAIANEEIMDEETKKII